MIHDEHDRKAILAELSHTFTPLADLATGIHTLNQTWWHDPATGKPLSRNRGEMLMLIVSEISECMEGERKGLQDTHLPSRPMAEVELADTLIRILDYAAGHGYDLAGAVEDKLAYNISRADHSPTARLAPGGKKF